MRDNTKVAEHPSSSRADIVKGSNRSLVQMEECTKGRSVALHSQAGRLLYVKKPNLKTAAYMSLIATCEVCFVLIVYSAGKK